ncbi:VWA domain-containing protein [Thermoflavimicrobium dichotomicum]|uniref:VWFA domain-containing protein n=1 Tax=Thermoflavimicrobium dichotomicum TaxID=46223 RepID=A0A1I3UF31_9BACL|nr:VWA domain-containing protein [Thermoflavimicrobium dichotomicum]SFJ80486.1 hypothetical protein SAMN05421852_12327 [Thermoflavimicrobium dichotomicum]
MRKFPYLLLSCLLILSACSDSEATKVAPSSHKTPSQQQEQSIAKEPPIPKAPTSLPGLLEFPPGKLLIEMQNDDAGIYSFAKKYVDLMPNSMKADQAYDRLLYYFNEDWQHVLKLIDTYDPSLRIKPEKLNLSDQSPVKININILLDAGQKTATKVSNHRTLLDILKREIENSLLEMKPENTVSYQFSLRTYGAKTDQYALLTSDLSSITQKLSIIQSGNKQASMSVALRQLKNDLAKETATNTINVVYIISVNDSFKDNPDQLAKELSTSDIQALVNVFGINVDQLETERQLKSIAASSQGLYNDFKLNNDQLQSNNLSIPKLIPKIDESKSISTWGQIISEFKQRAFGSITKGTNISPHGFSYDGNPKMTAALDMFGIKIDQTEKSFLYDLLKKRQELISQTVQPRIQSKFDQLKKNYDSAANTKPSS